MKTFEMKVKKNTIPKQLASSIIRCLKDDEVGNIKINYIGDKASGTTVKALALVTEILGDEIEFNIKIKQQHISTEDGLRTLMEWLITKK